MPARFGWGDDWKALAQHPWLMKIVIAAMIALVVVLMMRRHTREREAKTFFSERCVLEGTSAERCEDLLDRHHTRCFAMSFAAGSRTRPESFDRERYFECVRISPGAWSAKRRRDLELQRRQSEEP